MKNVLVILFLMIMHFAAAQNFSERFEAFKKNASEKFSSFRDECNRKYAQHLQNSWKQFNSAKPMETPRQEPVPVRPFDQIDQPKPIENIPLVIPQPAPLPQPVPVEPVRKTPRENECIDFLFFEVTCKISLPSSANRILANVSPKNLHTVWSRLSENNLLNNTLSDCLETRNRLKLCDWAYLLFLNDLSRQVAANSNAATLLMAYLYCQSGYQMRLARDGEELAMLFASRHQIFDIGYFDLNGTHFYPFGKKAAQSLSICDVAFNGEAPLSLIIDNEQQLGSVLSNDRTISSGNNPAFSATTRVPRSLIEFFNTYPSSAINDNQMTRWAMYANTPLANETRRILYPQLKKAIANSTSHDAANLLLNWVQTGLVYEYDDKVWGHDRAFFAEETLFYPYADCEDRSILFSRLVRDLLGLDVALIYYPGHLATAVCFNEDVKGDAMIIDNRRFIVCDPTFIGAPVGASMPGLQNNNVQAIILN